jgi:hypothetical protein
LYVLELDGANRSNVIALVGDNCSTNVAFAHLAGVPLVGCASHRFQLCVKDMLEPYEELLANVNSLMKCLKNLVPAARLRKLTHLAAKTCNRTRWSSTFDMIMRYTLL